MNTKVQSAKMFDVTSQSTHSIDVFRQFRYMFAGIRWKAFWDIKVRVKKCRVSGPNIHKRLVQAK